MADFLERYDSLPAYLAAMMPGTSAIINASVGSDEDCSSDGYLCIRDGGCTSNVICGHDGCDADTGCANDHPVCYTDGICTTDVCRADVDPPSSYGRITATTVTKDSITVWFSSISGASGYEIVWRKSTETALLGSAWGVSSPYIISGLDGKTEYAINYKGYATNQYGYSAEGPFMPTPAYATTKGDSNVYIYDSGDWQQAVPRVYSGGWQ